MALTPYQPIIFGPKERRLFGIYHLAQSAPVRPAVVMCNAFGQEAIRAHRFQRALAERLARAGHPVLRFDYFGTGDSMGEDADGDPDGWCEDIRTAHQELRHLTSATSVVWVGMRLGASLALRAAQDAPSDLAKLILWDPVLDGLRYLSHLRERHVASLEAEYSLPQKPSPRRLAANPANYVDEAIGFALSPEFRGQVSAIALNSHVWPARPTDIVVVADPDTPDGTDIKGLGARTPARVRMIEIHHGTNWTTDTAANTSLVPTAALLGIAQQVGETR
jgi:pimeloyl-ACP methyl ester carboxylesterase